MFCPEHQEHNSAYPTQTEEFNVKDQNDVCRDIRTPSSYQRRLSGTFRQSG